MSHSRANRRDHKFDDASGDNHTRLLKLALRAKTSNATRLMQIGKELLCQKTHYEQVLRTAPEFDQVEIVIRVLEDQKLDIDAHNNGRCIACGNVTALHFASQLRDSTVLEYLLIEDIMS